MHKNTALIVFRQRFTQKNCTNQLQMEVFGEIGNLQDVCCTLASVFKVDQKGAGGSQKISA